MIVLGNYIKNKERKDNLELEQKKIIQGYINDILLENENIESDIKNIVDTIKYLYDKLDEKMLNKIVDVFKESSFAKLEKGNYWEWVRIEFEEPISKDLCIKVSNKDGFEYRRWFSSYKLLDLWKYKDVKIEEMTNISEIVSSFCQKVNEFIAKIFNTISEYDC